MNYAISSIEFFANTGGRVTLSTVPTTWVADNATTMAFEQWKDQRAEVLKESPSMKAKWSDFKVHMDPVHTAAGFSANLTPFDGVSQYVKGEWDASQFVFPNETGVGATQECLMHVVGDNLPAVAFDGSTNAISLVDAYVLSRAVPQSPDPSLQVGYKTGPWADIILHDDMSEEVIENLATNNDEPPYSLVKYPGGPDNAPVNQVIDVAIVRDWGDSTQFSSDMIGPVIAPLGLLDFHFNFADDETITIVINLVPGSYKGVLAERGL